LHNSLIVTTLCSCLRSTLRQTGDIADPSCLRAGAALTCAAFSGSKRSPVLAVASDDGSVTLLALTGMQEPSNDPGEVYAALGIAQDTLPK